MFTIMGSDGKEYGPVSAEQTRAWLAGGRANLDTKAKAAGSDEWRRLGDFPEFSGTGSLPPPPVAAGAIDPKVFAADLIARAAPLRIGALDLPVPFAPELEDAFRPTPNQLIEQLTAWMG